MNCFSIIAADPPAKKDAAPGSPLGSPFFFFFIILVMMYFLIIRPQSKQRKAQAARVASSEKGDKIVTVGGLHGTIHHISDKTITLKLSEGVFVPFEKSAIQSVNKVRSGGGGGGSGSGNGNGSEEKEEQGADLQK